MRSLFWLIGIAGALLLAGCDGVSVGNGLSHGQQKKEEVPDEYQVYTSKYNFSITYHRSLKFEPSSDERTLVLDNTPSTKEVNHPSRVRFSIEEFSQLVGIRNETRELMTTLESSLAKVVKEKCGSGTFTRMQELGEKSVYGAKCEWVAEGREKGNYFLITPGRKILSVDLDVDTGQKGARHVREVLESLSFDDEGPIVKSISVVPAMINAGEEASVIFEVENDVAGIDVTTLVKAALTFEEVEFDDTGIKKLAASVDPVHITVDSPLEELDSNHYLARFRVNPHKWPGHYVISSFALRDMAQNPRLYEMSVGKDGRIGSTYKIEPTASPVAVMSSMLVVKNYQLPDREPVEVEKITILPTRVDAGGKIRIRIAAYDKKSSVNVDEPARFVFASVVSGSRSDLNSHVIRGSTKLTRISSKTYEGELSIPKTTPDGDYAVARLVLSDEAENPGVFTHIPWDPGRGASALFDWPGEKLFKGQDVRSSNLFKVVSQHQYMPKGPIIRRIEHEKSSELVFQMKIDNWSVGESESLGETNRVACLHVTPVWERSSLSGPKSDRGTVQLCGVPTVVDGIQGTCRLKLAMPPLRPKGEYLISRAELRWDDGQTYVWEYEAGPAQDGGLVDIHGNFVPASRFMFQ